MDHIGHASLGDELAALEGDDFIVPSDSPHGPTRHQDGWYYNEPAKMADLVRVLPIKPWR